MKQSLKNVIFVTGLIVAVSLIVVAVAYFFYSQIDYVNLARKEVTVNVSEEKDTIFVRENDEVLFSYSIEDFRNDSLKEWNRLTKENPFVIKEDELSLEDFSVFLTVSKFPKGQRSIIFPVSTSREDKNISLFWVLDIGTRDITFFGEENKGIIGNVVWSSDVSYFAYTINTRSGKGEYFSIDNARSFEKEVTISGDDILENLEVSSEKEFNPGFRGIGWSEEEEGFFFITETLEEGAPSRWIVFPGDGRIEKRDFGA